MKATGICPKCKSNDILAKVRVVDRAHGNATFDLSVAMYKTPNAMLFKGKVESKMHAWICVACGYTEMYTDAPSILSRAMRSAT